MEKIEGISNTAQLIFGVFKHMLVFEKNMEKIENIYCMKYKTPNTSLDVK